MPPSDRVLQVLCLSLKVITTLRPVCAASQRVITPHAATTIHSNDMSHSNVSSHGNGTAHGNGTSHGNAHHGFDHHLVTWLSALGMLCAIALFGGIFLYVYNKFHLPAKEAEKKKMLTKTKSPNTSPGIIGIGPAPVKVKASPTKHYDVTVDVIHAKDDHVSVVAIDEHSKDPDTPGTSSQENDVPDHMPPDYHTLVLNTADKEDSA